ncbi:MAG: alpha/beta fold hydrolase [Thermodesulfobacteriota bacterium]
MTYRNRIFITLVLMVLAFSGCAPRSRPFIEDIPRPAKNFDLVLVHGLLNKHRWGPAFLDACLKIWGSGNVYIVFTSPSPRVWSQTINGRGLIGVGEDDHCAGTGSLETQTGYLEQAVALLQKDYGLGQQFDVIAHSMGGLASRRFIYRNPGVVAGLVTLGTPHHGSPLAESFGWAGFFLGARAALDNLRPDFLARFNQAHPVAGAPLFNNGVIHTIRGGCPEGDCYGWGGELSMGWDVLKTFYHTDSDGLVPQDSAVIEGARHVADFPDFDHYELVLEPGVALKAAEYLP